MFSVLKNSFLKVISFDSEYQKMISLIKKHTRPSASLLDVGCGFGRYLKPLKEAGFEVCGVDANEHVVEALKQDGFTCYLPNDFEKNEHQYDVIVMSHIIEHFTPKDLLSFMDTYLSRLKPGGYLFISTPLYSNYFYDDFDHIKPYHPGGLQMVFSEPMAQVQYQSVNKIKLLDLWFRKSPIMPRLVRGAYLKTLSSRFQQLAIVVGFLIYHLSFKLISKKDGWIGVYQKVQSSS